MEGASNTTGDDRLAAGIAALAHLQSAALEVIAALRASLDVAEDLVKDQSFMTAGGSVAGVITRVFEAVEPLISNRPGGTAGRSDGNANPPDTSGGPVQHIRVS
jgi:hypothetical protein